VSKVAKQGLVSTQTGTPYYASPEIWKDKPYDSRSDIWSLGCVLYEMTALKPPFTAKDMKSLYTKVIRGYYPSIPKRYSEDLDYVISQCLNTSPTKRPKAEDLMNSHEMKRHIIDVKEDSSSTGVESPKTTLLNTIKLPKKLLDISKRLPKANYGTPLVFAKNKALDIKIAKGLPEIFENHRNFIKPEVSLNSVDYKDPAPVQTPLVSVPSKILQNNSKVALALKNRLYRNILKKNLAGSPMHEERKIKLPRINRVKQSAGHNHSVMYSCRSLSKKRDLGY